MVQTLKCHSQFSNSIFRKKSFFESFCILQENCRMSADKKALQIENDVLKMGGLALSSTFLSNCDGNISIGCLQRPLSNQIAFEKLYSLQIPLKVCKRIVIQCTKPKHALNLHFYQK